MISIQIRSLKVFCDVVRRRSFSQAASDHGMTQSAASQTVQNLEEYLSVQLIDRSRRPFVLTAEGQRFYEGLSTMLRQFDTLVAEVRQSGDEVQGQVTIGSIYSAGLSYLPAIEQELQQRFPKATSRVQLAQTHEVYKLVEQGTVDFGLISYPEASKTIQATHWQDEPMVLVASPRHRLASEGEVTPESLNQCGLVAFAPNLRIRQEIDRHLRSRGITMRVVVELDNIDSVKHAVMVNRGLAFVPKPSVSNELSSGALQELSCSGLALTRPLGIIQRRHATLSRPARAFLELMMQSLGEARQEIPARAPESRAQPVSVGDPPATAI